MKIKELAAFVAGFRRTAQGVQPAGGARVAAALMPSTRKAIAVPFTLE